MILMASFHPVTITMLGVIGRNVARTASRTGASPLTRTSGLCASPSESTLDPPVARSAAFMRLETKANSGDLSAMHRLGRELIKGEDAAWGQQLLSAAAEKGHGPARFTLAKAKLRAGASGEAVADMELAAQQGVKGAAAMLADRHIEEGRVEEGLALWRATATKDRPDLMISLAALLITPPSQLRPLVSHAEAIRLLQDALTALEPALKKRGEPGPGARYSVGQFARAQVILGKCFRQGLYLGRDDFRAVELFQSAADLGNPVGMFELAQCCLRGEGTLQDPDLATALLHRAGRLNHPDALFALATYHVRQFPHKHSKNLPADPDLPPRVRRLLVHRIGRVPIPPKELRPPSTSQRVEMLVRASTLGHVQAMVHLGKWLVTGAEERGPHYPPLPTPPAPKQKGTDARGEAKGRPVAVAPQVERDVARGVELLTGAAERHSNEAAVLLSHIFVKTDPTKAVALLEPAAARGHGPALLDLGLALIIGKGATRDVGRGRELLAGAHKAGQSEALKYLEMARNL